MMENAACQLDFNAHKILIRPLAESDLPALEWDGEYAHFRNVYAQNFRSMQNGNLLIWVAETEDQNLVGQAFILLLSQNKELADGIHRAYGFSFRVKSEYRDQGLGTAIMNFVESDMKQRGFTSIRLNVARNNIKARKLYERLGYRVIGSDPGLWNYQDQYGTWQTVKEPAWKMLKQIA
jgi:ribosomal protein S18 acetylase RimI-like enzyme